MEGLLENCGILVARVFVASETEVSQTVAYDLSVVNLYSLEHVRMIAYDKIRSGIYDHMSHFNLIIVCVVIFFNAPVNTGNYEVDLILLQLFYTVINKLLGFNCLAL